MDNIRLTIDELSEIEYGRKYIGSGKEGDCYHIGNYTYKIYNERYLYWYQNEGMERYLLRFKDIFIDNVYFIVLENP